MKPQFEKNAGIALIVFTILMTFTMVLHPVGGSFERLLKIRDLIIITHVIAISSLPFAAIGFWGLTKKLGTEQFLSVTAFSFMSFALVAVMLAAAANGLVLPIFIQQYEGATPEIVESVRPVLRYSFSVNNAFDYIYTAGFCIAMLCWSVAILQTKKMPAWVAWLGIILAGTAIVIFVSGFSFVSLQGFRMFVSSIVLWILIVGALLVRKS